jgi:hypothetical protein
MKQKNRKHNLGRAKTVDRRKEVSQKEYRIK